MSHQQVPEHGLEGLGMRSDVLGVDHGDQDGGVGGAAGMAAVAADDSGDMRALGLGVLDGADQVGADLLFEVAAADGENEQRIGGAQPADPQPGFEDAGPAFVIGAGGQFGDVVGGRVGLKAADFAEIVDSVGSVGGAAPDAENEQTAAGGAALRQQGSDGFDFPAVDAADNFAGFRQKLFREIHRDRNSSNSRMPSGEPIS